MPLITLLDHCDEEELIGNRKSKFEFNAATWKKGRGSFCDIDQSGLIRLFASVFTLLHICLPRHFSVYRQELQLTEIMAEIINYLLPFDSKNILAARRRRRRVRKLRCTLGCTLIFSFLYNSVSCWLLLMNGWGYFIIIEQRMTFPPSLFLP